MRSNERFPLFALDADLAKNSVPCRPSEFKAGVTNQSSSGKWPVCVCVCVSKMIWVWFANEWYELLSFCRRKGCGSIVISMSCLRVCLCDCLSVHLWGYLWIHTHDLYQFFCARFLWPWLSPPVAGWQNPNGKGQFWGLCVPFKSIGNLHCSCCCRVWHIHCKMDHSVANNVMQQNGSFSMPCNHVQSLPKFGASCLRLKHHLPQAKGAKSAIYDCLVSSAIISALSRWPSLLAILNVFSKWFWQMCTNSWIFLFLFLFSVVSSCCTAVLMSSIRMHCCHWYSSLGR